MTKQRRPPTRSLKAHSGPSSQPPHPEAGLNPVVQTSSPGPAPGTADRRSTYIEAVALYEQGLEKLQRHDYRGAAALFESVLVRYGEEKELHERAKLYLNICQRHVSTSVSAPHTVEERLYASTLALERRTLRRSHLASAPGPRRGPRQRSRVVHARRRPRSARRIGRSRRPRRTRHRHQPRKSGARQDRPRPRSGPRRRCLPRRPRSPVDASFRAPAADPAAACTVSSIPHDN